MNVQVVYCTHETAGLDVREQIAFSTEEQLQRAYRELRGSFPAAELVVVSTCNRVEVYTAQEADAAPTQQQIAKFLSEFHRVPLDRFVDDLLERTGPDAVRHLFEVASSIDSMVVGEPQIVSQIKEAYGRALKNNACGPLTNELFQSALRVSARIRGNTRLAEGRVSIASVAVGEFAKSIFDRFDDKTVLVIGAGEMAVETIRYLKDEGVRKVVVVNRSVDRAARLAEESGGEAHPFDELDEWMARADVIVSTTGADRPLVDAARFAGVRRGSGGRPVFVLDLGTPRDFDPAVADVDENVFLFDIDALQATCDRNRKARHREIRKARQIIDEETDRFMHDVYHRATGPVVKRLREEWHAIRQQEMELLRQKLEHADTADLAAIERSIERIINKLLHPPLKALRDESREGTPHGLLTALKRLFHIGEQPPEHR